MHTRPVQISDEPFLFELFSATKGAEMAAWGLPPAQLTPLVHMQYNAQRRSYQIQYPEAEHSLILLDEQPIGQFQVHRSPGGITLIDISLLPQFRGTGVGTRLIQALQGEAHRSRLPLHLQVATDNPGARRLYERLGFTKTRETDTHLTMEWR